MIKARNLTSHTYNTEIADDIVSDIHTRFFAIRDSRNTSNGRGRCSMSGRVPPRQSGPSDGGRRGRGRVLPRWRCGLREWSRRSGDGFLRAGGCRRGSLRARRLDMAGCAISRGTWAKIEAQIRSATDVELYAIALALKVPISTLYPKDFVHQLKVRGWTR